MPDESKPAAAPPAPPPVTAAAPPRRALRWDRLQPHLLLGLFALLLHRRELLGETLFTRDTYLFFGPAKKLLADALGQGRLPYWTPYEGLGLPFLSQPQFSVFHPTTALFAFLPPWQALALQNLCGTAMALWGAYALARALSQPRAAATLAAVLFGLGGWVVSLTEFPSSHLGAGSLPWTAWALLVALRRGGATVALPALAFGLMLVAGEVQYALLAAAFGGALAIVRRPGARAVVLSVASPAVGAALAAVQLLPTLLLAGDTERAAAMADWSRWPVEARHLAGMVLPVQHAASFATSTFVGPAALGLAAAAVVCARRRMVLALAAAAALFLWAAAGDGYGLYPLLRDVVPMWDRFRYPIKLLLPVLLAVALLAGEGYARARGRLAGLVLGGVSVGSVAAALAVSGGVALPALGTVLVCAAAVGAAALLPPRYRAFGPVVAGVQALAFAEPLLPTTDRSFWEPGPLAQALREAGVGLEGPYFDRLDAVARPRLQEPFAHRAGAGGGGSSYQGLHGLPAITFNSPAASLRVRQMLKLLGSRDATLRLAHVLGVGYLVLPSQLGAPPGAALLAREPEFDFAAWRLRETLPRAYFAPRALAVADAAEARSRLFDPAFVPGRDVLIENAPSDLPQPSDIAPSEAGVAVPLRRDGDTVLSASAVFPRDGWLVVNEAWFAGWSATVDGAPVPLHPANGAVRALPVAAGRREVRLEYRVPGLATGAAVSGATAVVLAAAAVVARRRPRRTA